ncbi:hypothetical protein BH11PLA2_BH11PLA2_13780 [soil metagenome]
MSLSVPLLFSALEAVPRRGEPVTVGLPWPRGAITDEKHFHLLDAAGVSQALQVSVMARWPDHSIKWCVFDFLATWDGKTQESGYRILVDDKPREEPAPGFCIESFIHEIRCKMNDKVSVFSLSINCEHTAGGVIRDYEQLNPQVIEGLTFSGSLIWYRQSQCIRYTITVANPQPADHPGGNWDLGNGGSIFIDSLEFAVTFPKPPTETATIRFSPQRNAAFRDCKIMAFAVQDASGGKNWRSDNHLDRHRRIPMTNPQATIRYDGESQTTLRATPILSVQRGEQFIGMAIPYFWESFPKSLYSDVAGIKLVIFPQENTPHELQGGEQTTLSFTVAYQSDTITHDPLVWARSPITVTAPPEWYAASGALGYLKPKATDTNVTYLGLVDQAMDGPDTFQHKREKIDEYGWRHFGDIWGDHEAIYHPGPEPMISHYNNQYDCVNGFMIQYLRSGDTRWLQQGLECADHTCDIDVYHTTGDKSAYNGGLFWHTYHYAPADTGTHRSYPRSLKNRNHFESGKDLDALGGTGKALQKNYAVGGGPSAAHNYNAGLALAYYLTGNPQYRDTAIGLADFVLNMDDGRKTVFRWLCRSDTGLAIESSAGYLGPGRASANSLLAVLTAHELTGDAKYLAKSEQIIRRVVHPKQNLERLDLLNAELRWFYTMFLQALGRYLDYKIELDQLDEAYAYARLCLLHYAKWMAVHEYPILDKPEKLQYPTETWAAQDMRKVEVFQYAAKHRTGADREKYLERAEWFFRYVERTLDTFPPTEKGIATKSLCRPVILMMNFGWSRAWWQQHPDAKAPEPRVTVTPEQFGEWSMFVPQKQIAIMRAKRLVVLGGIGFVMMVTALIAWLVINH